MSDPSTNRTPVPPRRVFGAPAGDSALDADDASPVRRPTTPQTTPRRPSAPGRVSFSTQSQHRPSFSRWRSNNALDEEGGVRSPKPERPAIPSALQPPPEVYSTPLPMVSMIVLSISMLGEFLCANVSAPFLLFMVESFDQFENEADVGYWTGILVSTFFLTQFLTSLLWATVAAKHGQRLVVGISLLGSAITCVLFGTSKTIQQAMAIRLAQGVFAGAIGVARGTVASITDPSNEGRAYAILGQGAIRLPPEKNTDVPTIPEEDSPPVSPTDDSHEQTGIIGTIGRKVSRRFSGIFASRVPEETLSASTSTPVPLAPAPGRARGFSRGSAAAGSAYGYNGSYRARLASHGTLGPSISARRASMASYRRRRESNANTGAGELAIGSYTSGADLNFAQRLLMANENTVTSIADLWVAAAINVDNEEVFEDDDDWQYGPEASASVAERSGTPDELTEEDMFDYDPTPRNNRFIRRPSVASTVLHPSTSRGPSTSQNRPSPAGIRRPSNVMSPSASGLDVSQTPVRRYSTTTAPIFSHVGVRTPPAVVEAQKLLALADEQEATAAPSLAPITEDQRMSQINSAPETAPESSLMSQLPLLIIFQYGVLALHSTTHDQVFYLYLVS
ncbi:hypothetical protein EIP86_006850 [Pleurotus ostreatoroseus]|nr:hypothetical protein EIP86_006850 [Pleurotus ostreatoroseus]